MVRAEVVADELVDPGGGGVFVAHLILHESRIPSVFQQVRGVGASQ